MKRVEIRGFVVYDPDEVRNPGIGGMEVCARIEDLLFNEDFAVEWEFTAVSDTEFNVEEDAE
ncbi:hypothetical protein MHB71_04965 [Paenibacillus sp. FSL H7-0940]|uniref:hypothetical protein n=1 Tax=Paenibacillus sp. FSL H7-0940 TaxID=2921443 RepID=UPI0030EECACA